MPLLLSTSQEEITAPYEFKETKIRVYSLEEALYHVYHNWKKTVDDYLCGDFISWVGTILELPQIASKLREISRIPEFSEKLILFLSLIPYFSTFEIKKIERDLKNWESQNEWDKLQDRANDLFKQKSYDKAYSLYLKAISYDDNPVLNYNIGICLMKQSLFENSLLFLEKSYISDNDNENYSCAYIESLIRSQKLPRAKNLLELQRPTAKTFYLWGEFHYEAGDAKNALISYEKAYSFGNEFFYLYRIVDIMAKQRKFDKALELLKMSRNKNPEYFLKLGEIYVENKNISAAIKSLETAIISYPDNVDILINLATYYRLDYNTDKATFIIQKALHLQDTNKHAILELAKIEKARGNSKRYQELLNEILTEFTKNYRKNVM